MAAVASLKLLTPTPIPTQKFQELHLFFPVVLYTLPPFIYNY